MFPKKRPFLFHKVNYFSRIDNNVIIPTFRIFEYLQYCPTDQNYVKVTYNYVQLTYAYFYV